MSEDRRPSLSRVWRRLFGGPRHSARQERVLSYVVSRLDSGAHLDDVVEEEYVRRQASPAEVERILNDPEVVEAARKRVHKDLKFEGPNPR